MPINAGELDRRVVIQRAVRTTDTHGESVIAWDSLATVWAKFEAGGGSETHLADRRQANQAATFTLRWLAGVMAEMRVLHDGDAWDIESVEEPDRRESLLLRCRAVQPVSGNS